MLTAEQNDLLTRIGPGTPAGNMMRRYWQPIAAVSELEGKWNIRVRLLGEDLVLFRDKQGRIGLIDDPATPLDVMALKRKALSLHWELMCTRSLFGTADIAEQGRLLARVAAQMKAFPGYAQVRKVTATLEPWTVEDGLLTPTLKIKRPRVMEKFNAEIDGMYSGH